VWLTYARPWEQPAGDAPDDEEVKGAEESGLPQG
jgi:hypothetical protein